MNTQDKRDALEEIIEKMDEIAELIRAVGDDSLRAYCLAAFEGRDAGWLGYFERDHVQAALDALDDDEDDDKCDCTEEDERLGLCEHGAS
jgi:hypothetical protein